jgi:hypothetical protein
MSWSLQLAMRLVAVAFHSAPASLPQKVNSRDDDLPAQLELRQVVVETQSTVFDKSTQGLALIDKVFIAFAMRKCMRREPSMRKPNRCVLVSCASS